MQARLLNLCVLFILMGIGAHPVGAVTTNIFSTQFEAAEGYNPANDLAGQKGWMISGSGGNGLLSNYLPGEGQHAYIGFTAPDPSDDQLLVWKPINYSPIAANTPVVKFSVLIGFVDSTTNLYDDFYWSVYNTDADHLFTVNFNNDDLSVYYALDGTNRFESTGETFTHEVVYELVVTMNFASNSWSATLDGELLATNKPITTVGAKLDLGDVDAGWILADPARPGDNFMVFDNYSITAEVIPPAAPRLTLIERTPAGNVYLQLEGQSGARFAIDATTDLSSWTPLVTNNVSFPYLDTSATALTRRFYRARWVP
jgi:hypothetical protein